MYKIAQMHNKLVVNALKYIRLRNFGSKSPCRYHLIRRTFEAPISKIHTAKKILIPFGGKGRIKERTIVTYKV